MNKVRKLVLSTVIAAAASGSLQASETPYPFAPIPNQEYLKAQQQAFESQRKSYMQAMEAQQKAMSEYMQKMLEQQQAYIEAQGDARFQPQNAVLPPSVTPYSMPGAVSEWAEAQRKAMETQRQEIEKQMRSAMEQQQAFINAQRNAGMPAQDLMRAPTPAFEAPYFTERFDGQQGAFEKERKAYVEAMQAQRKEIEKQMQKRYEEYQSAFEAQRKAFEERRRSYGGPLALDDTTK